MREGIRAAVAWVGGTPPNDNDSMHTIDDNDGVACTAVVALLSMMTDVTHCCCSAPPLDQRMTPHRNKTESLIPGFETCPDGADSVSPATPPASARPASILITFMYDDVEKAINCNLRNTMTLFTQTCIFCAFDNGTTLWYRASRNERSVGSHTPCVKRHLRTHVYTSNTEVKSIVLR